MSKDAPTDNRSYPVGHRRYRCRLSINLACFIGVRMADLMFFITAEIKLLRGCAELLRHAGVIVKVIVTTVRLLFCNFFVEVKHRDIGICRYNFTSENRLYTKSIALLIW